MKRARQLASEITLLIPKLLRGMKAGFVVSPRVTTSQLVTLMRIHEKKVIRAGALSKEMRVSAPTITGVIDRLVRGGYVRRSRALEDRRIVEVRLSRKGESLARKFLSEINRRWLGILIHLNPEDRENYLRILRKIVGFLNEGDK